MTNTQKKKLGERPFEYRIRVKYLMLGFLIGSMTLALALFVDIGIVVKNYFYPELERTETDIALRNVVLGGILLIFFAPLAYFLWYSKKPPKKYPNNEPVGLKWDWEKVKDI